MDWVPIVEKLERAKAHIREVHADVQKIVGRIPHHVIGDDDLKAREDFQKTLGAVVVPVRTRIVVGEAIHQMRSALDHLVTALGATGKETQFPICIYRPTKPKDVRAFQRKIAGVPAHFAAAIKGLQPYHLPTPDERRDYFLTILKRLNNADKHQAPILSVVVPKPHIRVVFRMPAPDDAAESSAVVMDDMEVQRQLAPHVVFAEFGTIQNQPVVEALTRLHSRVLFNVVVKLQFLDT
jgi:hypothetical protein